MIPCGLDTRAGVPGAGEDLVEPVDDGAHPADREVVQLVAEPVVAGPAPDQRDGARVLDRLVGVEVVRPVRAARVVAEPVRALRDHLVGDDARPVVEDLGHVAQADQVVLDRRWSLIGSNWPSATAANAVYSPSVANSHG